MYSIWQSEKFRQSKKQLWNKPRLFFPIGNQEISDAKHLAVHTGVSKKIITYVHMDAIHFEILSLGVVTWYISVNNITIFKLKNNFFKTCSNIILYL